MKISIEYCGTCNYRPAAAALALMIEMETGIKPVLVHSSNAGAFEVTVDGVLIYSKLAMGIFPDNKEIVTGIKTSAGRQTPQDGI